MDEQKFDEMLTKYADVTVKIGLNLRKGQSLSIRGILEDAPFIRKVVESAYQAGAKYVDVLWTDERTQRLFFEYANSENIEHIPEWLFHRFEEYEKWGDARLAVYSTDPDLLEGIDPELIAKHRKAFAEKVFEPLRKYENFANWCVVATATPSWARKVFPGLPVEEAKEKLWEAIFQVCRIDVPDPVSAWKEHTTKLIKYKDYLNTKRYASLHYKGPGTDLTLGLPENQVWSGAQESFTNGVTCTVNIPTEEVFTAPHKDKADGVVKASLPLNLGGIMVEEFNLTFEHGRAVKVTAKKGEEDLRKLIETDENAGRLGEAALVPHSSPISQRGHMFYNTLFDENAASHIALGNAYRSSIKGGEDMTEEEFAAQGGNKSLIHVDFMVGSGQLDIDGICDDGTREPVMRAGEWVFDV
ncbi:MAG TPA: aminopeptidase [Anaerolineales bacterium]|nr:aminopeptidase [Anaerolineales bacterium]